MIEQAFSVTQLNDYIKSLIDSDELLQTAVVSGEISNFKKHFASGHLYFSLKDEKSVIKCVMFAREASRLRFLPDNGMVVTLWGRVSVFARDGAYQLYASYMSPEGVGDQHMAFEYLKNKLAKEGLFDLSRKKSITKYPHKIGVITSATGAAIRDIYNVLNRRWPVADIELFPALVQGDGAVKSLVNGIEYFNNEKKCDVIILGRGGGSGEDLSAFNDETLARAISNSAIPIISAVGHEIDYSISDFVADLRAPTPSAAAELAVPDINEYLHRLNALIDRAGTNIYKSLQYCESKIKMFELSGVLSRPTHYIEALESEVLYFEKSLDASFDQIFSKYDLLLQNNIVKLNALNPLEVLSRGYALVAKSGSVVASSSKLKKDDLVSLTFGDGTVNAVIK